MASFEKFYAIYKLNRKGEREACDYGLKYLKEEYRELINSGIEIYSDSCYADIDFSGKHVAHYQQEIREAINKKNQTLLQKNLEELKKDIAITNAFHARKNFHHALQNETLWDKWHNEFTDCQKREALRFLQNQWKLQGDFCFYTSKSLLFAIDILLELEWHLQEAKLEFSKKGKRLPTSFYVEYKKYLENFSKCIDTEKNTISWTIYYRCLLACEHTNATYDDVLLELAHKLKKLGIKLEMEKLKNEQRCGLNADIISLFLKYICEHGNTIIKQKIASLSWFNGKNNFPLIFVENVSGQYFIPHALKLLTPIQSKKPSWIFKNYHKRFVFFQNKSEFLLSLAMLSEINIKIKNINNPQKDYTWCKLKQLQSDILFNMKLSQAYLVKGSIRSLFSKESNRFFSTFIEQLKSQQKIVFEKRLDFIEQFIPKIQPLSSIIGEALFSDDAAQDLIHMLNELEEDITVTKVSAQTQMRFFQMRNKLINLIEQDFILMEQKSIRQSIEKKLTDFSCEAEANDELCKQIIESYRKLNATSQLKFIYASEKTLTKISAHLKDIFKIYIASLSEGKFTFENIELVYQYGNILKEFDYFSKIENFKEIINILLSKYRDYISSKTKNYIFEHFKEIDLFEGLLLLFLSNDQLKSVYSIKIDAQIDLFKTSIKDIALKKLIRDSEIKLEKSKSGFYETGNYQNYFGKLDMSIKKLSNKMQLFEESSRDLLFSFMKLNSFETTKNKNYSNETKKIICS